jgi:adenosylhomocysteine nucleosidase
LGDDLPQSVRRSLILSADRDLLPGDISELVERYGAVAVDWESAAIAWVAQRNLVRCLILRGVTDLVGLSGGEAYANPGYFQQAARQVMSGLIASLPLWLNLAVPD